MLVDNTVQTELSKQDNLLFLRGPPLSPSPETFLPFFAGLAWRKHMNMLITITSICSVLIYYFIWLVSQYKPNT